MMNVMPGHTVGASYISLILYYAQSYPIYKGPTEYHVVGGYHIPVTKTGHKRISRSFDHIVAVISIDFSYWNMFHRSPSKDFACSLITSSSRHIYIFSIKFFEIN